MTLTLIMTLDDVDEYWMRSSRSAKTRPSQVFIQQVEQAHVGENRIYTHTGGGNIICSRHLSTALQRPKCEGRSSTVVCVSNGIIQS